MGVSAAPPGTSVGFSEQVIPVAGRARHALVVEPRCAVTLGRERLDALRHGPAESGVDQAILREVQQRAGKVQMVLVRGRSASGDGSWGFSNELTDTEVRELAELLVHSQLPAYRRMVRAGIKAVFHVEVGFREVDAYRAGTRKLLEELERTNRGAGDAHGELAALARLDRWVLRYLPYFFTTAYEKVLRETIPNVLPHIDGRERSIRNLVESVPAHLQ